MTQPKFMDGLIDVTVQDGDRQLVLKADFETLTTTYQHYLDLLRSFRGIPENINASIQQVSVNPDTFQTAMRSVLSQYEELGMPVKNDLQSRTERREAAQIYAVNYLRSLDSQAQRDALILALAEHEENKESLTSLPAVQPYDESRRAALPGFEMFPHPDSVKNLSLPIEFKLRRVVLAIETYENGMAQFIQQLSGIQVRLNGMLAEANMTEDRFRNEATAS